MTRLQRHVFISATIGYSIYYVCRLSLSVIKGPLVQEGRFTEAQLGLIGSGLFYAYAVGKFVNGFLADRANINRFLTVGIVGTAVINLLLGFELGFATFAVLWLVNGWFQSMGAPSCIVGLARWFERAQRGTYYGLWSATHNIGEGLTFVAVALVTTHFGWQWGFWGAAGCGLVGAAVVAIWFHDRPKSATEPDAQTPAAPGLTHEERRQVRTMQVEALRSPLIWLIAMASAFMYVARYAINSWGVFFFEFGKGYPRVEAGMLVSVGAVCGVLGTIASGWVSDRWFPHSRFLPALLAGILNCASLAAVLAVPGRHPWLDYASMAGFGVSIGALICYLGGLLAIDSVPKQAAGAALGVVGIASYIGAGLQDAVSGHLIGLSKIGAGAEAVYDFTLVGVFWVGASAASMLVTAAIWLHSRRSRLAPAQAAA